MPRLRQPKLGEKEPTAAGGLAIVQIGLKPFAYVSRWDEASISSENDLLRQLSLHAKSSIPLLSTLVVWQALPVAFRHSDITIEFKLNCCLP